MSKCTNTMNIILNHNGHYMCGDHQRLCVKPFPSRDGGTVWFVHDAEWITDADVRAGYTSPTVAVFETLHEALHYCSRVVSGELTTLPHESNFCGWPTLKERVDNHLAGERK